MKKFLMFLLSVCFTLCIGATVAACGTQGAQGEKGESGADGKSAYQLACENGYQGSLESWLASLVGETGANGADGANGSDGKSAYQLACENGFEGSLSEWLDSLIGETGASGKDGANGINGADGKDGKSAYQLACENGFEGSLTEWLASLVGKNGNDGADGINGVDGEDGKSAYQLACENGYKGDLQSWLASLVGAKGEDGADGEDGKTPYIKDGYWWIGNSNTQIKAEGVDGANGINGADGKDGKSVYELYCEIYGYEGSEEEWLEMYLSGSLVQHTVQFDWNGGTPPSGAESSVTGYYGKPIALPIPTKEGYTFVGWYTGDSAVDGCFTTTDILVSDMQLMARWQANELTVTFVDYYGEVLQVQTVSYGASAVEPAVPTYLNAERLVFSKWDKKLTNIKADMTVTAVYVANVYTITLDTDGGSPIAPITCYNGETPLAPATPQKTGFVFGGWFLERSCVTQYNFDYPLNKDTVLYAKMNIDGGYSLITTAAELSNIAAAPDKSYLLGNNIDLQGETWTPLEKFSGVLDGNGHKIYNFIIDEKNVSSNVGFMRVNTGVVQNILFADISYKIVRSGGDTKGYSGVVVGVNEGTVLNVCVQSAAYTYSGTSSTENWKRTGNSYVGGVVGHNKGVVSACSEYASMQVTIAASMTGTDRDYYAYNNLYCGGIVGYNAGSVLRSKSYGDITVTGNSYTNKGKAGVYAYVGGITGENAADGSVEKCSVEADIAYTGERNTSSRIVETAYLGGCVGNNKGQISDSYFVGNLTVGGTAQTDVKLAGITAYNYEGAIVSRCYAKAVAIATTTNTVTHWGGIVGLNATGAIVSKSYAIGELTAVAAMNYGFVVGENSGTISACYFDEKMRIQIAGEDVVPTNNEGAAEQLEVVQTQEFLGKTLYWDMSVWKVTDGELPLHR